MSTKKIKIAFVNPPHADWSLANNAAYLMFQSHYKRFGKYQDKFKWLNAPYKYNRYTSIEDICNDGIQDADIYLFSSYVWNYEIIDKLAEFVKQKYPDAITVVGGPHIGAYDAEFLDTRTNYDFFLRATKPGEVFVQELLDSYIDNNGTPKIEDLSWELRSQKSCIQFMPDYSVYEEHLDFLRETREYVRNNDMEPFAIIETTRGCPYQCVFCEWGGGIGGKVYKKPTDIVKRDILALKEAGFRDVYLTDANFGAFFDRDVEIFKFGWDNRVNLTDISTMKSKDLDRRIKLVDAWFDVVGSGPETHSLVNINQEAGHPLIIGTTEQAKASDNPMYISVVPTVSIQSISEEAMKVANRVDLSLADKIKLSQHINKRCHEEGFPIPAIELIMAMPGSTIEDFYNEMTLLWNFKAWTSLRHDYMFLPDSDLCRPGYLEQHKIELVEVYTDLVDEDGVDNVEGLYRDKRHHFKTIASSYSFTREEVVEMWIMNLCGNWLLKNMYEVFKDNHTPAEFGKACFKVMMQNPDFVELYNEAADILNPDTPARNIKRLKGVLRNTVTEKFLIKNQTLIFSEVFRLLELEEEFA